jgi:ABC-type Zn uptake system ZnuABC Zn-binding protein ZnuA
MRLFLMVAVCSILLLCSCATTAAEKSPTEASHSGVESITVGGEITVRGEYLRSD